MGMSSRLAIGTQLAFFLCVGLAASAWGQDCPPLSEYRRAVLMAEHLFGGRPSNGTILVRRGYVTEYDAMRRVPRWAAWRATPGYLQTPKRTGKWASFRIDREVPNPVRSTDYLNLLDTRDLARGHLVPYFISGGDRNSDGIFAAVNSPDDLSVADLDDACTVFEVNVMSNIAPQLHSRFNGSGGLWNQLETRVRENIVGSGKTVHVIAGSVFGNVPVERVGPSADIQVPHMFYKILVSDPGAVAFLLAHPGRIGTKGCALDAALEDCIVSIADIEALSGLDFLAGLDDAREALLEGTDGRAVWHVLLSE